MDGWVGGPVGRKIGWRFLEMTLGVRLPVCLLGEALRWKASLLAVWTDDVRSFWKPWTAFQMARSSHVPFWAMIPRRALRLLFASSTAFCRLLERTAAGISGRWKVAETWLAFACSVSTVWGSRVLHSRQRDHAFCLAAVRPCC